MKIKTKLTLGVGLLFALILLLSVVATININALKNDTENILTANYNSIQYCRNMLATLQHEIPNSKEDFQKNLHQQQKNVTEIGEADLTDNLAANYNQWASQAKDSSVQVKIIHGLFQIMDLNMEAIEGKSQKAKATADKGVFWIAMSGTLCFLIAFVLLINLPANIANPIKELSQSIQQIASRNYSERVHFKSESEFGQLAQSFNTMAKKLEEYNNSSLAKLMMEKKRTEAIINNMHDPVIGLDEQMHIIFANEEAIKISGLQLAEIVGMPAAELAQRNDLIKSLILDLDTDSSDIAEKKLTIKIFAADKESYFEKETLHIHVTPTGETENKLVGHVIILRNVTSYKELDYAKTNFIATISHEFKTPIASIQMSLQLMEDNRVGKLNAEQSHLVDSIKEDTNRLLKITGELLNITQVESGNIQLAIMPSDAKEIVLYAIQAAKTQAEQKNVKFSFDFPETISLIQADNEKTAWVLINLISNAIRYSYEYATIYLKISEAADQVLISIKDTGQGIPEQYQTKIFERYFRVPGSSKEGTGLGLAISKEFIEAQGGSITVHSEYGAGSNFVLSFKKVV